MRSVALCAVAGGARDRRLMLLTRAPLVAPPQLFPASPMRTNF
jgi:hypothetical protein